MNMRRNVWRYYPTRKVWYVGNISPGSNAFLELRSICQMKYYGAIEGIHNNFLLMGLGKYGSLFDNLKNIINSSAQDIIITRIKCISRYVDICKLLA